jgi:hypothetical protein
MNKLNKKLMSEIGITKAQLTRLRVIEKRIQLTNERACNEPLSDAMVKSADKFEMDSIAEIHRMSALIDIVKINNDPRGPAIRLKVKSGYYNCPDQTLSVIEEMQS